VVAQLQGETASLAAEIKQLNSGESGRNADGELVYSLEATLKQSQEHEARVLQQLQECTEQLQDEERKKQETLDQLNSLKSKMERELANISKRVRAVNSSNPVSPGDGSVRESVDDLIMQNKTVHLQYLEEQVRQYDVSILCTTNTIREKKAELVQLQQQALEREENR
jgi:ABC-type transporter Mla subunit MlaD